MEVVAEAAEEELILESASRQEAVSGAEQVCDLSFLHARHCLSSGLPFHDTLPSLLSFLPASNHSAPAYAVVLALQIQATQLWLLLKAPKFLECSFSL